MRLAVEGDGTGAREAEGWGCAGCRYDDLIDEGPDAGKAGEDGGRTKERADGRGPLREFVDAAVASGLTNVNGPLMEATEIGGRRDGGVPR